ncbi:MAG: hypothetical protein EOM83_12420 [Clostridia bacterium]|nr:hypothetical protein [Clostridia bacterium]
MTDTRRRRLLNKTMAYFRNYRWAARLIGFLGLVLIISFMFGQGFAMLREAHASFELLLLLTLLSLSLVGYIVGWLIEIAGGVLLTLAGLIIGIFTFFSPVFGTNYYAMLLSLPLLIPGIFYLLSWYNKIRRRELDD